MKQRLNMTIVSLLQFDNGVLHRISEAVVRVVRGTGMGLVGAGGY
jgi:hypothetical protein